MAKQPNPAPEPEPEPPNPNDDSTLPVQAHERPAPKPRPTGANNLTFGEKAVGLSFNPSGDPTVDELKREYAKIIDLCEMKRQSLMAGSGAHRLWSIAITEAQGAQMWSVKAATWKD
jgi:hypothetical protein